MSPHDPTTDLYKRVQRGDGFSAEERPLVTRDLGDLADAIAERC